jgi:acetyltransferase-like isoleucine patch superfamily enzyme
MVGMGSVVTKGVADDSIVYGVPAKPARKKKIPLWRSTS